MSEQNQFPVGVEIPEDFDSNPNNYIIGGKRVRGGANLTSDQVVEKYNKQTGKNISLVELKPMNPKLHTVEQEPSWGDKALEFSKGLGRPIIGAATGAAAASLGAPALGAAALGVGGGMAWDMAVQNAQGKNGDPLEAAGNVATDEVGGQVFKYAGKLFQKGAKALKQTVFPVGETNLSLGQQLGDSFPGKFLQGAENLMAAGNKAKLMSRQAGDAIKKFYNINNIEAPGADHIIANTIEDIVEKNHTQLTKFADITRDQIAKIGSKVEARLPSGNPLSPMQEAENFFKPGTHSNDIVVKQPIPVNSVASWARGFLDKTKGSSYLPELRAEAEDILSQTKNGKIPISFDQLYNKFFAADTIKRQLARDGEVPLTKTAQKHFDELRASLRDDISNGIEAWQLPDKEKMAVQDAWIRSRSAFDAFQDSYAGVNGLQKLIEDNPSNKLTAITAIMKDPNLLRKTLATGALKLGDGALVSKDVKKDFGTLYLKNKLESAWDPIANRFDGNKLISTFKESADAETQGLLFNSKQRADLAQLITTIGQTQMKGPSSSQNIHLSKAGLMMKGGLAGAALLGSIYGIGPETAAIEIGLGGFAQMAVKNPTLARQFAELLSGKPLGQSLVKYGNQLAGALNGVRGVVTMKNGTKVPGEWKDGKFVPNEN